VYLAQVCFAQKCPAENNPNGVVMLPHADCTKYYACNWGNAIEQSCPGDLHFNAASSACDYPYSAGCDPSRSTVGNGNPGQTTSSGSGWTIGTGTQEVTVEAPFHPNCPAEDEGETVHFAHEYDCARFYKCSYGRAHEHVCPGELHFNAREQVCDYPSEAGCDPNQTTVGGGLTAPQTTAGGSQTTAGGSQTTAGGSQTTAGSGQTTAGSGNTNNPVPTLSQEVTNDTPLHPRCPAEEGEFPYHFEHESDCTKFYKCSFGRAHVEVCDPPGLHFNRDLQVCDYPESAGCDRSLTTAAGSQTTNGGGGGQTTNGGGGGQTTNGGGGGQTTNGGQATVTQEVEVGLDPRCEGIAFDKYYHFAHADCGKFYMCSSGHAYVHNCPPGLHFNAQLQLCDWPASAGCA